MGIFDYIEAGRYTNKVPFSVEAEPIDEDKMTVRQAREHKEQQRQNRHQQRAAHRLEDNRLAALFKSDLEQEHDVAGHKHADRLFSIAWSHGHSSGYAEVASLYDEFVQLIK